MLLVGALKLILSISFAIPYLFAHRVQFDTELVSSKGREQSLAARSRGALERRNFSFTLINNSTLPLNILALPKMLSLYGKSANNLMPGGVLTFVPGMGVYDFHAVISDGENQWDNVGAATWGLTKYGTSYVVSSAIGAGTAGTIAIGATAFVTAALTTVVAPAVLIYVSLATFWGTALVSSMTVSALTYNAMDIVMDKLRDVGKNNTYETYQLDKMEGLANKPTDHSDRLLRFTDVVTEELVLATFRSSYPDVDLGHVVMTRRHAEAYFSAMVSEFKDWGLAKGFDTKWLFQGGFTPPKPLGSSAWSKTSFESLKLGKIQRRSSIGLCQKSLQISYKASDGASGRLQLQSDWDEVLVAEKKVQGNREGQQCKKRYFAMCQISSLRMVKVCRLTGLQGIGVNATVWDEVSTDDRKLTWFARGTTLSKGEFDMRVLVPNGPGSSIDMKEVSFKYVSPE